MKNYAIITDSACDLSTELVEEIGVEVVPMGLMIDGKSYKHYHNFKELSLKDFYNKIREGHIGSTSCANTMDIIDKMTECIKKGLDILYLSFSSGMSSSYQSAVLAAREVQEEYPDTKIEVIDTLCGSIGLGMITYLAAKRKQAGDTLHQTVEYVKEHCKNICHYFMVDDLKYIQKSGRISALGAMVGYVLNVKPIFKLSNEGKISLFAKIKGRKMAINKMVEALKEKCTMPEVIFICHADAEDTVKKLEERIKEEFPNADIKVSSVGPIVGNNTGPGTIATIFHGTER